MKTYKKFKRKETCYRLTASVVVAKNNVHKCDKFDFMCSAIKVLSSGCEYIELVSVHYDTRILSNNPRALKIDIRVKLAAHAKYSESEIVAIFNRINDDAFGVQGLPPVCADYQRTYMLAEFDRMNRAAKGEYYMMPYAVKIKKGRDIITSCNSVIAKAYTVALKGVKGRLAFPNVEAKKYFMALLKNACKTMSIRIMAFSITHSGAYLTVCNFDAHKSGISMAIKSVSDSYLAYYNKQFGTNILEIFTRRSSIVTISPDQIFNSIAKVVAQPELAGVKHIEAQQFSSSNIVDDVAAIKLVAMYINTNLRGNNKGYPFVSDAIVQDHMRNAFRDRSNNRRILGRFEQEKPKYYDHFEACMYNFGLLSNDDMSRQEFALVALDMHEVYRYDISEVLFRSFKSEAAKANVLAEIVYNQIINKRFSLAKTRQSLGSVELNYDILAAAIVLVNERKGYSYNYIVELMDLSQQDTTLESIVIEEVCEKFMLSPLNAMIKLNIA